MPKCDFNKVACVASQKLFRNFVEIALRHGCSPVNLLHIFRTSFPKNTCGWLVLNTGRRSNKQLSVTLLKQLKKSVKEFI